MAQADAMAGSPVLAGFNRLSNGQKLALMVGVAAAIALVVGMVMWSRAPEYRVLFSNLSDRDGGAVVAGLQQQNIPYRIQGGGTVLVPADRVYQARLQLAQQGLPRGGAVGFELLESQRLGTSQFIEQVNYQRALEGELARTVQSLAAVQAARVHLAIPRPSVFVRDQQRPSASVLVSLYPGRALDASQLAGITHLVSSSVPELSPRAVTIVDQAGNLLTRAGEGAAAVAGLDDGQLKHLHSVEQSFVRRIEAILAPVVGPENVRAQVTAELDFSVVEQTAETFKPNPTPQHSAVRSQQTIETIGGGTRDAGGVPGALTNQPPGAAAAPLAAPPPGPAAAAKGAAPAPVADPAPALEPVHKESTINFELDKTITHTRSEVGALRRLSAAVVVNHRREVAADGTVTFVARDEEEMNRLTTLVRQAIGFNDKRGDAVNVINAAFNVVAREEIPVPGAVERLTGDLLAHLGTIGRWALLVLGVLLVWLLVVRPLLRELAQRGARELEAAATYTPGASAAPGQGPLSAPGAPPIVPGQATFESELDQARSFARQQPAGFAGTIKSMMNS